MTARDDDRFEDVGLVRLTTWATAAAVALTAAALASLSPAGSQRVDLALAAWNGEARQAVVQREPEVDNERRGINETLRLLASDRDRLASRLASLERNLDDVTGSIRSQAAAPPGTGRVATREPQPLPDIIPASADNELPWLADAPEPWPSPSAGMEFAAGPPDAAALQIAALPVDSPAAASTLGRTEFGVDLGSASNLEDVRLLWSAMRAQHGRLFGNLRPAIQRRDDRAGHPEYRLIIGPLANAGAAARLCATLAADDVVCSTKAYQGERFIP
jgi:hypothetical protein